MTGANLVVTESYKQYRKIWKKSLTQLSKEKSIEIREFTIIFANVKGTRDVTTIWGLRYQFL